MKRLVLALGVCVAVGAHAVPAPELIPFWDLSDENNTAQIDHGAWQELLDAYLAGHPSGVNRFDYAGLIAAPDDRALLRRPPPGPLRASP